MSNEKTLLETESITAQLDKADTLLKNGDMANSLATYDSVLALAPTNREALLGKAKTLLCLDRTPEAKKYLEYAARHNKDDKLIWDLLGKVALSLGQWALAIKAFTNYQRLDGASADTYTQLAIASYFDLDIDRAKQYVDLALIEDPDHQEAGQWQQKLDELGDSQSLLLDVGQIHCNAGRYEQGIEVFTKALASGDSSSLRLFLGRAYLALGQLEEAIPHLEEALNKKPRSEEIMADLATTYYLSDRKPEAEQLYDCILETESDNTDALLGKARLLLERKEYQTAWTQYLEPVLIAEPSRPEAWLLEAQLRERTGDLYKARVCADHAIALEQQVAADWAIGAGILLAAGEKALASLYQSKARQLSDGTGEDKVSREENLEEAEKEVAKLTTFIESRPAYLHAYQDRAQIYELLNLPRRSVYFLDELCQKWPDHETEQVMCHRGFLLLNIGLLRESRSSFTRALEINTDSQVANEGLSLVSQFEENVKENLYHLIESGLALCRDNKFEEGLKYFDEARVLSDSFEAQIFTARALMALNRYQEAIPHIVAALEIEPGNPNAEADLAKIKEMHLKLVEQGRKLCREGKLNDGINLFNKALEIGESLPAFALMGKALVAIDKNDEAIEYLQKALTTQPDSIDVMHDLAKAYISTDLELKADELYDRILKLDEKNVNALLGKGDLLLTAVNPEAAQTYIDSAIIIDPSRPAAWLVRARLFLRRNNLTEARLCADHAIALNVNWGAGWSLGADILQASGNNALAERYLAVLDSPSDGAGQNSVDRKEPRLGEVAIEATELEAFIAEHPIYGHAYNDRSIIYRAVGELNRARHYQDNYIAVRPTSSSTKSPAQPASNIQPGIKSEPVPAGETVCRYCGKANTIKSTTCKYCGMPLTAGENSQPVSTITRPQSAVAKAPDSQETANIHRQLAALNNDIKTFEFEMDKLAIRRKIGDLSAAQYNDSVSKLQNKLRELEKNAEQLSSKL